MRRLLISSNLSWPPALRPFSASSITVLFSKSEISKLTFAIPPPLLKERGQFGNQLIHHKMDWYPLICMGMAPAVWDWNFVGLCLLFISE